MKRTVFIISDGTGITAEALSHSLLTQFDNIEFENITIPYVDTVTKAQTVVERINQTATEQGTKPLVFSTLINPSIRHSLAQSKCLYLDFFNAFIEPIEAELGTRSSHSIGRTHGLIDYNTYKTRIDAVNYALAHDDGVSVKNYQAADIILIGISRSGKTPTCLYLALQFGISAANFPLTEEVISSKLPAEIEKFRHKLFGLTIEPERLHAIRSERRPNSHYASLNQCKLEIKQAEDLFQQEQIPFLNSTTRSIEEIATTILAATGVKRRLF